MKEKIKKIVFRLWYRFPQTLPIAGMTCFEEFCDRLLYAYDLPSGPSYYHAIATMIMNQSPVTDKMPPRYFAKAVRKAMANEIAYAKLQQLRAAEKKEHEESKGADLQVVSNP